MKKGRDFSTIYDLTAVRIIVDNVKDCYGSLGHRAFALEAAARPLQRLHRHAQAEHVPVAAYDGRRSGRRSARDSNPDGRDAPHQRVRHRRALALQGRRQARRVREQADLAALAAGVAKRHARFARVHGEPEARPVRESGLHLLAEGRRLLVAFCGGAARLRVSSPHRRRPPLRRRESERQDRSARLSAAQWGHLRDSRQQEFAAVARLAGDRANLER